MDPDHLDDREPSQPDNRRKGWGAIAATLGVLALKFKTVLAFLLQFKYAAFAIKGIAGSWTFLLSLWLYVALFGWRLGIIIVFAVLAHELGHYAAFRAYGLSARLPVFIPLFGAFTSGELPADLEQDAYIALAGPLTGLGLAGACYGLAVATGDRFWFASADVCAFINLFNMIPSPPFDGGRVIGAIWPPLWFAGFVLFVALAFLIHVPLLFVLLIGALGLPAMLRAWRGEIDPRAATMTNGARLRVSVWYLATLFGLIFVVGAAHAVATQGAAL